MSIVEGVILGLVQGATEFLPISSSGHLIIIPHLFGWELPSVSFGVFLHMGTLVSAIAYFWRDLRTLPAVVFRRTVVLALIATIPAGLAALIFRGFFENLFEQPAGAALLLLMTGLILLAAETVGRPRRPFDRIRVPDAIGIGVAQILALAPGISRSGVTMAAGVVRGVDRAGAARFSFVMSIPIVLVATLEELATVTAADFNLTLVLGFIVSAVTGYLAIKYLIGYLKRRSFRVFAVYCLLFGGFTLFLSYLR